VLVTKPAASQPAAYRKHTGGKAYFAVKHTLGQPRLCPLLNYALPVGHLAVLLTAQPDVRSVPAECVAAPSSSSRSSLL
jgi:hypothetical protein